MFGHKERLLDVWPQLATSPLLTHWGWSSLVHSAFDSNRYLLPTPSTHGTLPACNTSALENAEQHPQHCVDPYTPLTGLLALHLRRGDFSHHCKHLGRWGADWMGFNAFPSFIDQWTPLRGGEPGKGTAENIATYMQRCYPTIDAIVAKIADVRQFSAARGLRGVYIMTNGDRAWVDRLKAAIALMGGWDKIASSRDLALNSEQKEVAHAVDMMIGQRAQVFVGNGVSPWCLQRLQLHTD